jgi:hypothetical protein
MLLTSFNLLIVVLLTPSNSIHVHHLKVHVPLQSRGLLLVSVTYVPSCLLSSTLSFSTSVQIVCSICSPPLLVIFLEMGFLWFDIVVMATTYFTFGGVQKLSSRMLPGTISHSVYSLVSSFEIFWLSLLMMSCVRCLTPLPHPLPRGLSHGRLLLTLVSVTSFGYVSTLSTTPCFLPSVGVCILYVITKLLPQSINICGYATRKGKRQEDIHNDKGEQ